MTNAILTNFFFDRYKKPEAEDMDMGSRNFWSGYTMLNTAPNDSIDSEADGFFNRVFRRRSHASSNPVEGKRFQFISDDA